MESGEQQLQTFKRLRQYGCVVEVKQVAADAQSSLASFPVTDKRRDSRYQCQYGEISMSGTISGPTQQA